MQSSITHHQGLNREVNEAIERGLWPGETHGRIRFRCECGQADCNEFIELTTELYERVRQDGRRFVVMPGHLGRQGDIVIERGRGYVVVQKRGLPAAEAEASDPRR
jgi:hypothetical protein